MCINYTAACAVFGIYHFVLELGISWTGHAHKSEITIDLLLVGVNAGLVLLFLSGYLVTYCSHDLQSRWFS